MTLGPLSITTAAVDGLYSLRTALELASLDEDMTGYKQCSTCSIKDSCRGVQYCIWPFDEKEGAD